jgi:hypothetical protein
VPVLVLERGRRREVVLEQDAEIWSEFDRNARCQDAGCIVDCCIPFSDYGAGFAPFAETWGRSRNPVPAKD